MPSTLSIFLGLSVYFLTGVALATNPTVDTLARKLGTLPPARSELADRDSTTEAVHVLLRAYEAPGEPEGEPQNREILIRWVGAQDAHPLALEFLPAILSSALEKEDPVMGEPVRRVAFVLIGNLKLEQFRSQLKALAQAGEDPALNEVLRAYGKLVSALPAPERPAEISFVKSLFVSSPITAPAIVDAIALTGLETKLVQAELNSLLTAPSAKVPVSAKLRLLEWASAYPQPLLTEAFIDSLQRFVLSPDSPAGLARIGASLLEEHQRSTPEIQARLKNLMLAAPAIPLWQGTPVAILNCHSALGLLAQRRAR